MSGPGAASGEGGGVPALVDADDLELGAPFSGGDSETVEVLRARWVSKDRDLAVKRVDMDLRGTAPRSRREMVQRKAADLVEIAAATRSATGLCPVLGVAVRDRSLLVVMPVCARGSLAQRLAEGPALSALEVVDAAVQVLEGLCALHERGIVHGTIKPSNVLVDDEGRLLLTDYGLAGIAATADVQLEPRRVGEEARVGAGVYAAPECRGEGRRVASLASDAYALAAVLCHAASGQGAPADGRPPEVPDTVPEPLRSALRGALREVAEERMGVADMLVAANESRRVLLQTCCICRCEEEEEALTACSAGAHRICKECLGSLVGTLADNTRALTADGDVVCKESTKQECGGAFRCNEMVEALVQTRAAAACAGFVHAVRRQASAAADARAEALRVRVLELEAAGMGAVEATLEAHRRAMEDLLVVIRCPGCRRPGDVDVQNCMALYCAPDVGGCGSHFCAWCMEACPDSDAAHAHVSECGLNPNRPHLYASERDHQDNVRWEQRLRVVARLRDYFTRCHMEVGWATEFATLPAIRDLGLRWEDVRAHMDGVVVVRTGDELVEAAKRGGVVELGGGEVVLRRAVRVRGTSVTVRNGTVRVIDEEIVNDGYGVQVEMGGRLTVENVRVVGTGLSCEDGGQAELQGVEIADCRENGVFCRDQGSKIVVQGGRIMGSKDSDGVACEEGGQVELRGVEIADCRENGVVCTGHGSTVVVQGGRITGSKGGAGVACLDGGHAEVRDVEIADCNENGVSSRGQGSNVVVQGGRITGSVGENGVACEDGGHAEVRGVEIANSNDSGVFCDGPGSKVVVQGGRITGSVEHNGVACHEGGQAEVRGVEIADCKECGVFCTDQGSKVVVQGGRITGSKNFDGVECQFGGQVEVRDVQISDCRRYGLSSDGRGSRISGANIQVARCPKAVFVTRGGEGRCGPLTTGGCLLAGGQDWSTHDPSKAPMRCSVTGESAMECGYGGVSSLSANGCFELNLKCKM